MNITLNSNVFFVAYDNFVLGTALQNNVTVVDATETISCLHQTSVDGNYAGHKNLDHDWNMHLMGDFNFDTGRTTHAQYQTLLHRKVKVLLVKRYVN